MGEAGLESETGSERASFGASDEELVRIVREAPEGDLRAFEVLVERYRKKVLSNCRHITREPSHAEDLAQEVFVKVYFGLARFEGRAAFRSWMQRIKVNHCLNFLKKRGDRQTLDIEDPAVSEEAERTISSSLREKMEMDSECEQVNLVLDSLSDGLRIPLIMRDMDGLSYEEIARTLGIGLSAAKMRIKRGREQFQMRYHAD